MRSSAVMSISFICLISYCPATSCPGVHVLAHTDMEVHTSIYVLPAESRSFYVKYIHRGLKFS